MKPAPRPMKLSRLLAGIADVPAWCDVSVKGLGLDSRALERGAAFVALRGGAHHGLDFAAQALAAGAGAILFEPPGAPPAGAPVALPIENLRAQLGAIADRYFDSPSRALEVIGVTGTNGKTSTVQLLAQALSRLGRIAGTIGTLGAGLVGAIEAGERTTPDVISTHALLAAMRERGASHVAMEVSSHALDQGRVDAIEFRYAIFTNLTRDHLDYHGDMQAYGTAKAKLFAWPGLQAAVINADDGFGRELLQSLPPALRRYSYSASAAADAQVRASAIVPSAAGIAFNLDTPWGGARVQSRLLGRFNVDNLLAVATCLGAMGFDCARIAATLAALDPVPGRMSRLGGTAESPLVVIDYAHTPDALEQSLRSLRAHTTRKLICVFGCGGERDRGKRPQMAAIAERLADAIVVTDDNPRGEDANAIVAEIVAGLARPERAAIERDRAQAITRAIASARAGDCVLVAGKGHELYQEIGGRKLPFDDMAFARAALEERT